jgi:hypothetical protein
MVWQICYVFPFASLKITRADKKLNSPAPQIGPRSTQSLARRLGLFDATMLVMGGIIGTGIFMNPYVVAQRVHTPALVLGAWLVGGCIALLGGFIWAELASVDGPTRAVERRAGRWPWQSKRVAQSKRFG